MKLLPLDRPELIELVANWLSQEDNCKWLDFGNGVHSPSPVSLKVMTQRDLSSVKTGPWMWSARQRRRAQFRHKAPPRPTVVTSHGAG